MSFQITNNSANAVVTKIETLSSTYGSFTVTSGSFPLLSGDTISGTNTEINNGKGSPEGSILLFLEQGNAQIEYYLNGSPISAFDYASGLIEIKGPIVQSGDAIVINIDEAVLPVPSPTPSNTPSVTPTATVTPTVTPTPSSTPPPAAVSFTVASGATQVEACDNLSTGATFTIYSNTNPSNCVGCAPNTCFPCVTSMDTWYLDAGLTIVAPDMWLANYNVPPSSNPVRLQIAGGMNVGGSFGGC